jgi:hypothetical protein
MKQIKHMIQMREKAEQEKQATNQAILDEHIVDEIEQDLKACTCHDGGTPPAPSATCIKSCSIRLVLMEKRVEPKTPSLKNKRTSIGRLPMITLLPPVSSPSGFHVSRSSDDLTPLWTASNQLSFSLNDSCPLTRCKAVYITPSLSSF